MSSVHKLFSPLLKDVVISISFKFFFQKLKFFKKKIKYFKNAKRSDVKTEREIMIFLMPKNITGQLLVNTENQRGKENFEKVGDSLQQHDKKKQTDSNNGTLAERFINYCSYLLVQNCLKSSRVRDLHILSIDFENIIL